MDLLIGDEHSLLSQNLKVFNKNQCIHFNVVYKNKT